MSLILKVFVLILFMPTVSECLLDSIKGWLFGEKDGTSLAVNNAKFEVVSTDEKFLKFASALTELSPLDSCYHIVVFSLKKKCGKLTEEELGKLAVRLLNCQSGVENRPTFVCTEEMTIAECTKGMDGATWNAYQIVGNRARAMCYSMQQDQFRRLTEMAVNDLATAAQDQLKSMQQLMQSQELLHSITTETVRSLYNNQQELLGTHQQLRIANQNVMSNVKENMDALVREKSLIAAGHKDLADMVESILMKLDATMQKMNEQDAKEQENYKYITEDLNRIQEKAQDALEKLDASSNHLLQNHKEMTKFYQEMYRNVVKINSSVTELMSTVTDMQDKIEKKISWFSHILGSSEDKLSQLLLIGQHVVYFLMATMLAAYLQVPRLSRLIIFFGVLLNSSLEVNYKQGVSFQQITGFIVAIVTANIMYHIWKQKGTASFVPFLAIGDTVLEPTSSNLPRENLLSQSELDNLKILLEKLQRTLTEISRTQTGRPPQMDTTIPPRPDSSTMPEDLDPIQRYINNNYNTDTHSRQSTPQPSTSYLRSPSRSSTPSRASSISSRCQGITRSGTPCRMNSARGNEFCHRHKDNYNR